MFEGSNKKKWMQILKKKRFAAVKKNEGYK
jgi:hypothetical protein